MPGKKGTKRAPDGSYVPIEEADRLWAEFKEETKSTPRKRTRKKKKVTAPEEAKKTEVRGSCIQKKLEEGRRADTKKMPRITITEFDEKGRMISTTYVCNPETLKIFKESNISYTSAGRPKETLHVAIDGDVLEIE